MSDRRDQNRANTHDTGRQSGRPRDDLRTASKKHKPNEKRDEDRDRDEKPQDDESNTAGTT